MLAKIRNLFKSYTDELIYKVSWPSLEELQSSTITVLFSSLILALSIFVADFIFRNAMQFFYGLFQ